MTISQLISLFFLSAALGMILGATSNAQLIPRRHVTRPCFQRCLPSNSSHYDYKYSNQSSTLTAKSKSSVLIQPVAEGNNVQSANANPRTKLFQWNQDKYEIDHCSISKIAMQIDDVGKWTLNLQADQNPKAKPNQVSRYNPKLHIKRNRFSIKIHCYAETGSHSSGLLIAAGQPAVAVLSIKEFWVENGQPKMVLEKGTSQVIRNQFNRIDHVEIEFHYTK